MPYVKVFVDGEPVVREQGASDIPLPPTQAEIDAELDQLAEQLLTNNRQTKALARLVFDIWNILETVDPVKFPAMTAAQFKQQIINRM